MSHTTEWVGADLPRKEDPALVRGQVVYVDDLTFPGMLHAAVLRSPHAHARIVSIDTAAAEALPGVHAVLTGSGSLKYIGPLVRFAAEEVVEHAIAVDKVALPRRGRGRRAAESRYVAEDALALVTVEYEPLPAWPTPSRRWPTARRSCTRTSGRTSSTSTRSRSATSTPSSPPPTTWCGGELCWPRCSAAPMETAGAVVPVRPGQRPARRLVEHEPAQLRRLGDVRDARRRAAPAELPPDVGRRLVRLQALPGQADRDLGRAGEGHRQAREVHGGPRGQPRWRRDAHGAGAGARRRAGVGRRRHVPQPAHQAPSTTTAPTSCSPSRRNTNPLSQIVGPYRIGSVTLRRHRGADQQEPAGRAARRGLRRHQLDAGTAGRRRGRRARHGSRRAAPQELHPARRVPVHDPDRQLLRLRRLPGRAGHARWSWPTSTGGGPSRSDARAEGRLHRHRVACAQQRSTYYASEFWFHNIGAPAPFTTTAESVRMRIGPTGGITATLFAPFWGNSQETVADAAHRGRARRRPGRDRDRPRPDHARPALGGPRRQPHDGDARPARCAGASKKLKDKIVQIAAHQLEAYARTTSSSARRHGVGAGQPTEHRRPRRHRDGRLLAEGQPARRDGVRPGGQLHLRPAVLHAAQRRPHRPRGVLPDRRARLPRRRRRGGPGDGAGGRS